MAPRTSNSFQSFVGSDTSLVDAGTQANQNAEPTKTYEDYSQNLWGKGGEIKFPEEASHADDGMNPGQRFIAYSKQLAEIIAISDNAKIENDPAGYGLKALIKRYGSETPAPEQTVELSKSFIDKHGRDAAFGVKTMNSEEDKQRMQDYVATVRQYVENVDLYFVKDNKTGKDLAIVTGDADVFNTIIKVEQQKTQLTQKVAEAQKEMNGQLKAKEQEVGEITPPTADLTKLKDKAPVVGETTSPGLDVEKWGDLAKSLKPSAPDPDKLASTSPPSTPLNPQRQQEQEKSGGIAA